MDINNAIQILQGRNAILSSEINAKQQEKDNNDLAISQLQGTLQTQLLSVTEEQLNTFPQVKELKDTVTVLTRSVDDATILLQEKETLITEKENTITTLEVENTDLITRTETAESKINDLNELLSRPEVVITPEEVKTQADDIINPPIE